MNAVESTEKLAHRIGAGSSEVTHSRSRRSRRPRNIVFVVVMLIPAVAYFAIWIVGPIFYGVGLSLTDANFMRPAAFIGLANYKDLITDDQFWSSLRITLIYALETVVPTLILSVIVARLLVSLRRGAGALLTLLFIPFVIPGVAAALVFGLMFDRYGIINSVFHITVAWLNDPSVALYALSITTVWGMVGYYVVILTAGYRQIPQDVIEAATIDRAGVIKRFWFVELPMIRPTLLFCSVTSVALVLTNFGTPYVLTNGGPGTATLTLPLLIYNQAFANSNAGSGEAMAVVMLIFTLILTAIQVRLLFTDRRRIGKAP